LNYLWEQLKARVNKVKLKIVFANLKIIAKKLKMEIKVLYMAYKRKETPILAKFITLIVVSYALSPIDLIPDFIPVLGYLDDVILLPLMIKFAIKLIPDEILDNCRKEVESTSLKKSKESYIGLAIVIGIWGLIFYKIIVELLN